MTSVARKTMELIRRHGLTGLPRLALYGIAEMVYERRMGIRTIGYLDREQLDIPYKESGFYAPSSYLDFRRIMRHVKVRAGRDVFLDYGAGMGRVAIMAAGFPFARVLGVEISGKLCEVARENVERVRPRLRCRDIEIVQADAESFDIPDDVTVVYMYNPFRGRLLAGVVDRMRASVERHPRPFRWIFKNTAYLDDVSDRIGWLEPVRDVECMTGHRCTIFESRLRT
jgi:16S rRNA G966 N2-methylase RsmD